MAQTTSFTIQFKGAISVKANTPISGDFGTNNIMVMKTHGVNVSVNGKDAFPLSYDEMGYADNTATYVFTKDCTIAYGVLVSVGGEAATLSSITGDDPSLLLIDAVTGTQYSLKNTDDSLKIHNLTTNKELLTVNSTTGVTSGNTIISGFPIAYTCERNAGPATVAQTFAFGNGASTPGVVMPYNGKVYTMNMATHTLVATQINTVQLSKNGVGLGVDAQISNVGTGASTVYTILTPTTPIPFIAGDVLNFISIAIPTTAPLGTVCTFIVKFD